MARKLTILLLADSIPPAASGQAMVLYEILRAQPDMDVVVGRLPTDLANTQPAVVAGLDVKLVEIRPFIEVNGGSVFKKRMRWFSINSALIEIVNLVGQTRSLGKIISTENIDVIVACTGRIIDIPSASIAARLGGIGSVAYIMDDYVLRETGVRKTMARMLELLVAGQTTTIVVNKREQKDFQERTHHSAQPISHAIPVDDIIAAQPLIFAPSSQRYIVYAGSVYKAQADSLVRLVREVNSLDGVEVHIYSGQKEPDIRRMGVDGRNVRIFPLLPRDELLKKMYEADILFLPLAFKSDYPGVIASSTPAKMGEYMATSVPILVHAPADSCIVDFFKEEGCGYVVDQPDGTKLKDTIIKILSNEEEARLVGLRAREASLRVFSPEVVRRRFRDILETVVANSRRGKRRD